MAAVDDDIRHWERMDNFTTFQCSDHHQFHQMFQFLHADPVEVKGKGVKISAVICRPIATYIRDGRHDDELSPVKELVTLWVVLEDD